MVGAPNTDELGVDENMLVGFSTAAGVTAAGVSASISASLLSSVAGVLAVSPSVRPNPEPNNEEPPPEVAGFSLSLAVLGSALKVVPNTKGDDPNGVELVLEAGGGKEVDWFMPVSCEVEAKEPDGFPAPKMLPLLLSPPPLASEPKPPLLANAENPLPLAGVEEAPPPKILPVPPDGVEPSPVCPKAGVAAEVPPVAHGDDLAPIPPPSAEDCPNAGETDAPPSVDVEPNAGVAEELPSVEVEPNAEVVELLPRADVDPNAGDPNADFPLSPPALPNAVLPNAGAAEGVAAEDEPHGDGFAPSAEEPPKLGPGVDAPKADVVAGAGVAAGAAAPFVL